MDYLFISLTALAVSALTLFSGFGLGTLLMPAFALFFPIPTAIAATAVVHLANNIFKLGLVGKHADWRVVLRFSLPAALAAVVGAGVLIGFAGLAPLTYYELFGREFSVMPVKLVIGIIIAGFAVLELSPAFAALAIPPRYLPLGGLLSGFFGGLSGNQGAFRTAFLVKSGLGKQAFVATGVVSAIIVDTVRLTVYGLSYFTVSFQELPAGMVGLVISASVAAFTGAFIGSRLLEKVTLQTVHRIVAMCMIGVGISLSSGLI